MTLDFNTRINHSNKNINIYNINMKHILITGGTGFLGHIFKKKY